MSGSSTQNTQAESIQKDHQVTFQLNIGNKMVELEQKCQLISSLDFQKSLNICDGFPSFQQLSGANDTNFSNKNSQKILEEILQNKSILRLNRLQRRLGAVRDREKILNTNNQTSSVHQMIQSKETISQQNDDMGERKQQIKNIKIEKITKRENVVLKRRSPQGSVKSSSGVNKINKQGDKNFNSSRAPHNSGHSKMQLSINQIPPSLHTETKKNRAYLSPKVGSRIDNFRKLKLRRGESIDVIGQQKRLNLLKTSEKSASSIDIIAQQPEDMDDGNSIISEEDSAFNDDEKSPPYIKVAQMRKGSNLRQFPDTNQFKEVSVQNVDQLSRAATNPKTFKRFETVGWKNQSTNVNKQPCRRSPTNKSGVAKLSQQDIHDLGYSKAYFKLKLQETRQSDMLLLKNNRKEAKNQSKLGGGPRRNSRNSSLNYMSDAMIDQLSMNFGKKYGQELNRNRGPPTQKDSNSVNSVITKGGTLNVRSSLKRGIYNAQKIQNAKNSPTKNQKTVEMEIKATRPSKNSQIFTDSQNMANKQILYKFAGEMNMNHGNQSNQNIIHAEMNLDAQYTSNDFKNSINNANNNLIKVYLQTPYKVLSINDINKKTKMKNNKDQQLYRAENQLNIHTQFRNQDADMSLQQLHVAAGFNLSQDKILLSPIAQNEPSSPSKFGGDSFNQSKQIFNPRGSKHSQFSDNKNKSFYDKNIQKTANHNNQSRIQAVDSHKIQDQSLELDSQIWMNHSQYAAQSQLNIADSRKIETNAHKIHLHTQNHQRQEMLSQQTESNRQFFQNLKDKLERRITQLHHHANIYRKQQKLYSIYGGSGHTKELDQQELHCIESSLKTHKESQIFEQGSIQKLYETKIYKNDNSLRLSPEFQVNKSSLQGFHIKNLNNDSCDSLRQGGLPNSQKESTTNFDQESVSPITRDIKAIESMASQNNLNNFSVEDQVDNLNYIAIDELQQHNQDDQLRHLLDVSKTLELSLGMQRELRLLEKQLVMAEKEFDQQFVKKEIQRFIKTNNPKNSNSSPKFSIQNNISKERTAAKSISKSFVKDSSSKKINKSPPVRMVSLQNKQKIQILSPATKALRDQSSLEQIGSTQHLHISTLKHNKGSLSPIKASPEHAVMDCKSKQSNLLDTSSLSLVARETQFRSIQGNKPIVKEYFDNKISMRRSIDKKLHYDHIRNQVNYYANVKLKKHQRLLEEKIHNQSQKLKQMTNNAKLQQVNNVKLPNGPPHSNQKLGCYEPQSKLKFSNNGSQIEREKPPELNLGLIQSCEKQEICSGSNTVKHRVIMAGASGDLNMPFYTPTNKSQKVKFPVMQNKLKNPVSKNQTSPNSDLLENMVNESGTKQTGCSTYFPKINGTSSNAITPTLNNQVIKNHINYPSVPKPLSLSQISRDQNSKILRQDQGILKSPRNSIISNNNNNTVIYEQTGGFVKKHGIRNAPETGVLSPLLSNHGGQSNGETDMSYSFDNRGYHKKQNLNMFRNKDGQYKKVTRMQIFQAHSQQSHHLVQQVVAYSQKFKPVETSKMRDLKHGSMPELQTPHQVVEATNKKRDRNHKI